MKKVLMLCLFGLLLSACSSSENATFRKAQLAADKGQFTKAIQLYSTILKENPDNYAAYAGRALAYERLPYKTAEELNKNRRMAVNDYTRAVSLNFNRPEIYNNLGALYIDMGDYLAAESQLSQALKLRPNYFMALLNRGVAYSRQGKMNEALIDFAAAERIDPRSPLLYLNRGLAQFAAGYYQLAAEDFSQMMELDPQNPRPYLERGRAFVKMNYYQNAKDDFEQAVALKPTYSLPYFYMAELEFNRGNTDQGIAYAEKAKLLAPTYAPAYEMLGDMLALESPVEATQHYLAARRLDPANALRYQGKIRMMTTEAGRRRVVAGRFYDLQNQR